MIYFFSSSHSSEIRVCDLLFNIVKVKSPTILIAIPVIVGNVALVIPDARALASGITKATLPTMTGMAISIVGLLTFTILNSKSQTLISEL